MLIMKVTHFDPFVDQSKLRSKVNMFLNKVGNMLVTESQVANSLVTRVNILATPTFNLDLYFLTFIFLDK